MKVNTGKMYTDSLGKENRSSQMNDLIDIGIFAADSKNNDGRKQANPLYLKKYRFTSGDHIVYVIVQGKPAWLGIDPYNKLIDQIRDDNIKIF
jgi:ABC-2 type transport system permease protein